MKALRFLSVFLASVLLLCTVSCRSYPGNESQNTDPPFIPDTAEEQIIRENENARMFSEKDLDASLPSDGTPVTLDGEKELFRITAGGTWILSGTMNGTVEIETDKTEKVTLFLNGVSISGGNAPAVRVLSADKVFLHLAEGTENFLSGIGTELDSSEDGVIFSKDDLTVKGRGSLSVSSEAGHGIVCKDDLKITGGTVTVNAERHGIDANDSVRIGGGSLSVTSGKDGVHVDNAEDTAAGYYYQESGSVSIVSDGDGIDASGYIHITDGNISAVTGGGASNGTKKSSQPGFGGRYQTETDTVSTKGLKSDAAILIEGGSFQLDCCDDAIHAAGNVGISGGKIEISTGDDGVHSDSALTVSGGDLTVIESFEGLEGITVTITGGNTVIRSSDDGINAADGTSAMQGQGGGFNGRGGMPGGGSSSCVITVSGGKTVINADGDGVDSNGTIVMTGGELYIAGPTSSADAAFDFETGAEIRGGTLVAVGAVGMAENVTSASQGSALVNLNGSGKLTLKDESGNVLVEYDPGKTYQCVLISCPGMEKGKNYTLSSPSSSVKIALTELIYGGNQGGPGGPGGRDPGFPGGPGEQDDPGFPGGPGGGPDGPGEGFPGGRR